MNPLFLLVILAANPAPAPATAPAAVEAAAPANGAESAEAAEADADEADLEAEPPEGLSDAVVAKLSAEQLTSLLMAKETPHTDLSGPIAIAGFFVTIIAIGGGTQFMGWRRYRLREDTLRAAIQAGHASPSLIAPLTKERADLRRGILWISTGLGVGAVVLLTGFERAHAAIALLPLAIGAGYLLSWKLLSGSSRARMEQQQQA